tara:strand:+ start:811 stop:1011 length:201 start_codon:yes stop_codon:yes gene_type:complete
MKSFKSFTEDAELTKAKEESAEEKKEAIKRAREDLKDAKAKLKADEKRDANIQRNTDAIDALTADS